MGFDGLDHPVHALHDLPEIEMDFDRFTAILLRPPGLSDELRRTYQRLGRHAAGIQAIPSHLALFDEGDLGAHDRGNVRGDQTAGACADHDQVAIKPCRPAKAGIGPPGLVQGKQFPGHPRENRQQAERREEIKGQNSSQGLQLSKLGADIHEDDRTRYHAEQTDDEKHCRAHGRQAHHQVDHKKREDGNQAQGEQVKRAVPLDASVHGLQLVSETVLHEVVKDIPGKPERDRGPGGSGEQYGGRPHGQAENGTGKDRQDTCTRQGKAGYREVHEKERQCRLYGIGMKIACDQCLFRLDVGKIKILVQVEQEKPGNQHRDSQQNGQFFHCKHSMVNPCASRVQILVSDIRL